MSDDNGIGSSQGYETIDGRVYHKLGDVQYLGSTDSAEASRLQRSQVFVKHYSNGSFKSPVKEILLSGAKVLEIGCGPGSWLLDVAQSFPNSSFVGIDLSDMFPTENLPSNVEFEVGNLLNGLSYPDNTFDFIYQRFVGGSFTKIQWETFVLKELARVVKPDGWIEVLDSNYQMISKVARFVESKGFDPNIGSNLPKTCEATGYFSEVRHEKILIPLGKRDGVWSQTALDFIADGCIMIKGRLRPQMNISSEDYDALIECFRNEADEMESGVYLYQTYFQKKQAN